MSTSKKPEFWLQRVNTDGTSEAPVIYSVFDLPNQAQMQRRGFLGASLAAGAVLAQLTGARAGGAEPSRQMLFAHRGPVTTLAVSPDGQFLYSASSGEKRLKQWSLPGGALRWTSDNLSTSTATMAVSEDGSALAAGSTSGDVKLWSLPDKVVRPNDEVRRAGLKAIVPYQSSEFLIVAAQGSQVHIGATASNASDTTFEVIASPITSVDMSKNRRGLLLGHTSGDISAWSLVSGKSYRQFAGHKGSVADIELRGKSQMFVSLGIDGTVRLWSLHNAQMVGELAHETVTAFAFVDDDTFVTATRSGLTGLWKLPAVPTPREWTDHTGKHKCLATYLEYKEKKVRLRKNSGRTITVPMSRLSNADQSYVERAKDQQVFTPIRTLGKVEGRVRTMCVTPDGAILACGCNDGSIVLWDLIHDVEPRYLFDPAASEADAVTYRKVEQTTGIELVFTLPCGSTIPPGATCICNCVPGTYSPAPPIVRERQYSQRVPRRYRQHEVPRNYGSGGSVCSCVPVCICMAVPVCQAHRLTHKDTVVRCMARELLLLMGRSQLTYMSWAASKSTGRLRRRIYQIIEEINSGISTDVRRWPQGAACRPLLQDDDEIVCIMAAQLLALRQYVLGEKLQPECIQLVASLLASAEQSPWYLRGV